MGSDPISLDPPSLVFGGPYSNLRARADELGIPASPAEADAAVASSAWDLRLLRLPDHAARYFRRPMR